MSADGEAAAVRRFERTGVVDPEHAGAIAERAAEGHR